MAKSIPELSIAFFGESGCGKTVLLSTYFGRLRSQEYREQHGYSLFMSKVAPADRLLSTYFGLSEGRFPDTSQRFEDFSFDVQLKGLPPALQPALRVLWYDYPGEWLTQDGRDTDEIEERERGIGKLLSCQVGFLVFDGNLFKLNGTKYLRKVLAQFRERVRIHKEHLSNTGRPFEDYPTKWIFLLSKADLFSDNFKAEDFQKALLVDCLHELEELREEFPVDSSIGTHFLLQSSLKAEDGRILDATVSRGLSLIAPLAFMSILQEVARKGERLEKYGPILRKLAKRLPFLCALLSKAAKKSPKLRLLLLVFEDVLVDFAGKAGDLLEKELEAAIKRRDTFKAICLAMKRELQTKEARRLYVLDEPYPEG